MRPFESEISVFCNEEWIFLNQVDDGLICSHIIAVLLATFIDKEFKEMDSHDQSLILWGCLLHDIAKRGPPEMNTKDPVHPFISCGKALRIFNRLGWIIHPEHVESIIAIINSSYIVYQNREFMDNSKLSIIVPHLLFLTGILPSPTTKLSSYLELTKNLDRSSMFVYEILAVILFHQSLNFDLIYPNYSPLTDEEILIFLSPRMIRLLCVLHKGDNKSYSLNCSVSSWKPSIERIENQASIYFNLFK